MRKLSLLFGLCAAACAHAAGVLTSPLDVENVSATTASITSYVDVDGGDDRNDCSAGAPCATLQATLNKLPRNIYNPVTVQLAPGQYTGAFVDGFRVHVSPDAGTDYAYLWISGTMVDFTPDAGSGSGTLTGATASAAGPVFATLSDTGAGWATDALKGAYVEITSGTGCCGTVATPSIYLVLTNTATTATVLGNGTLAAAGSGYRLRVPGTALTVPPAVATPTGTPVGTGPFAAGLSFVDNDGVAYGFSRLDFVLNTSNPRGVVTGTNRVRGNLFRMLASTGTVAGVAGLGTAIGSVTLQQAYFSFPTSGSITAVSYLSTGGGPALGGLTVTNSFFEGGFSAISTSSAPGALISTSYFLGQTNSAVLNAGASMMQITGDRFDSCAVALKAVESFVNGLTFAAFGVQNTDIVNSTQAGVRLIGPYSSLDALTLTGTGNAIGLDIQRGAHAVIGSAVTLTGTTEVSIDGAASSWATMRSATPKVISNPNYFTLFYE